MNIILIIIIAVILGALIGLERELHGKVVGIRTVSLITLGSALFAFMSVNLSFADSARIIAQVVTGIGFLGAGVLIKDGTTVTGLTTAATIWTSAAIGCLIGIGWEEVAIVSTIVVISINFIFTHLKIWMSRISKKKKNP